MIGFAYSFSNITPGFDIAVMNGINKPILTNSNNEPKNIKTNKK